MHERWKSACKQAHVGAELEPTPGFGIVRCLAMIIRERDIAEGDLRRRPVRLAGEFVVQLPKIAFQIEFEGGHVRSISLPLPRPLVRT